MTVYIDDMRLKARAGRINGTWSHLMADSTPELIAFARRLGLNPAWIQHPGRVTEHFDVTETKRAKAVRLGAIEIEYGAEGAALIQAKVDGETFDIDEWRARTP